mmetsp:Transcript_19052/g.26276  ORF Transcript_19052/g.26276 Transcript_19052/m.26276 type:complete len:210 (+) Transcript_19052:672-1301(+)
MEVDGIENIQQLPCLDLLLQTHIILQQTMQREFTLLIDINLQRVVHKLFCEVTHLLRHCRREHHHLFRLWSLHKNRLHIRTHRKILQTPIKLIQHKILHMIQIHHFQPRRERQGPSRSPDHNQRGLLLVLKQLRVLLLRYPPKHHTGGTVRQGSVKPRKLMIDLVRQLPGVDQHQGLHILIGIRRGLFNVFQQRKHKHRGFAHPGFRLG